MNKKENLKAALEGRKPERVPIWELVFELWDAFSGRTMTLGFDVEKLTSAQREKAFIRNAEIMVSVSQELGFAGVSTIGNLWMRGKDDWSYLGLPGDLIWEQLEILRQRAPDDLMLIGKTGGVICPPSGDGYVEFAYQLFDAPEKIEEQAQKTLASGLEQAKRYRDAGCEAVYNPADLADNHGPYFKPEHMERFITPYLHKWAAGIREMGMYSILHTDGNIEPIIDILADSGLNAIQALDPTAGVDITRVKRAVGNKLCLCGNVDCALLLTGPEDAVYRQTMDLLKGVGTQGGLVLGASNAVVRETLAGHYKAMIRAWEEYHA